MIPPRRVSFAADHQYAVSNITSNAYDAIELKSYHDTMVSFHVAKMEGYAWHRIADAVKALKLADTVVHSDVDEVCEPVPAAPAVVCEQIPAPSVKSPLRVRSPRTVRRMLATAVCGHRPAVRFAGELRNGNLCGHPATCDAPARPTISGRHNVNARSDKQVVQILQSPSAGNSARHESHFARHSVDYHARPMASGLAFLQHPDRQLALRRLRFAGLTRHDSRPVCGREYLIHEYRVHLRQKPVESGVNGLVIVRSDQLPPVDGIGDGKPADGGRSLITLGREVKGNLPVPILSHSALSAFEQAFARCERDRRAIGRERNRARVRGVRQRVQQRNVTCINLRREKG